MVTKKLMEDHMYSELVNIDLVKDHRRTAIQQAERMRLVRHACAGQVSIWCKICDVLARVLIRAANHLQAMAHSQPKALVGE